METENEPLYKLSIKEFIKLSKTLIDEALDEREKNRNTMESDNHETEDHFTIKGLSEFLNCTKASIHNYKKKGLPFYRVGRKILFRKQEVLKFMKSIKSKRIIEA